MTIGSKHKGLISRQRTEILWNGGDNTAEIM